MPTVYFTTLNDARRIEKGCIKTTPVIWSDTYCLGIDDYDLSIKSEEKIPRSI